MASKKKKNKKTKSKRLSVFFDGATNKGLVRKNNEDAFLVERIWDDSTILAVVIDGLGGYEGGEIAAAIAKDKIRNYLVNSHNGTFVEMLKQAFTSANNAIFEIACGNLKYYGMGCVLTAAIIDIKSRQVSMVHLGDTRMYAFHNGKLAKISHDHSQVGRMEELGNLSEEEAMGHPNRNIVDRVLGQQPHLSSDDNFIEAQVFDLVPNTTFLLCSDGLTDMITSTTIVGILSCKVKLKEKTDALIHASLDAGGKDNVTIVLIEYIGDETNPKIIPNGLKKDSGHAVNSTSDKTNIQNETKKKTRVSLKSRIFLMILGFLMGLFVGYCVVQRQMKKIENKPDSTMEKILGTTNLENVLNTTSSTMDLDTINYEYQN